MVAGLVVVGTAFSIPVLAQGNADAGTRGKKAVVGDGGALGPVVRPDGGPGFGDTPHGLESQPGAMTQELDPQTPAPDPATSPHAAGKRPQQTGPNDVFQPPEDGSTDDRRLPVGTLDVQIADPDGRPMPNITVTLGILFNSVAKGESAKRVTATTNDQGIVHWQGLDTGTAMAYRPMVITDDATFSVMPFRLSDKTGTRAILHVYPTESSVDKALVVTQTVLYAEIKDDRIQIQEAYKIYNFGKTAWVPKDLVVPLPENFTAFSTQQGMNDIGLDAIPKQGVKVHGTFNPGQQMLEFRWQLPYNGEGELHFDVGMPPHTAAARVIAPANRDMKLEVPGFPPPQAITDEQGQRSLLTEKQLRREDPVLKSVGIDIKNLPTEGPAKLIATFLAVAGIGIGLVMGTKKPANRDRKAERDRLLAELAGLEKAHQDGDVGPKTYERSRREILDAIAQTFAADAPSLATASTQKRRR